MKNEQAFTLIELLVVVLIIGILAAVALPQYQKAVWKSRGLQLMITTQALHTAQKAYYLANGTFATTFDELAIEIPFTGNCTASGVGASPNFTYTDCKNNKDGFVYLTDGTTITKFRSDSPRYRWAGFKMYSSETSQYPDELLCIDMGNGKKSFCALMGWNTQISCNNNGVCEYRK